jgi:peptide deformylase
MILPIVAYGQPVLRKICEDVSKDYTQLHQLIADMWQTMYHANGVGLAAPQVNAPVRIFMVDTIQIVEGFDEKDKASYPDEQPVKRVFINAQKIDTFGKEWAYNEGCLSIPKVREDVIRPQTIRLSYVDENFEPKEEEFNGITARVIMHEYDHIDGKLFIDYLPQLKRKLLKKQLDDISKGKVRVDYHMLLPK